MASVLLAVIYLAFISLGLPDSLLGAAWPTIYPEIGVPISYAGIISMIIALGTVVSSLMSERLTLRLGAGKVTALCVGISAASLLGFSLARSFLVLCLVAIPYGLSAGSIDASLNNYVALHYQSKHMSWLHCMWGVGAAAGPYIMGFALTGGHGWNAGYRTVGLLQAGLTLILLLSLPLWTGKTAPGVKQPARKALSIPEILRIPGAKAVLTAFFCYCAVEQTAILWAASYLTLAKGVPAETAALYASMFLMGITVGRALSGFLAIRFSDTQLIRLGQALMGLGILLLLLSPTYLLALIGLLIAGLGCAPVYPCLIHSTPAHFGADKSQAIIGVQMASAYIGTCAMPPLFGVLAARIGIDWLPWYLTVLLCIMVLAFARLVRTKREASAD